MRIYLMRHATAEEPGAGPDAGRGLTAEGVREAREAGEALRDRGAKIGVILTSPRMRARQTAEQVALALGAGVRVEVRERLTCGASAADYIEEVESTAAEILVVGHNPELSAIASGMAGKGISFRPATVCCIDLDPPQATLIWLR